MNKSARTWRRILFIGIATLIMAVFGTQFAFAQDADAVATVTLDEFNTLKIAIDTTWVLLAGFIVFFMQAGFAMLEAGLIRQTSVVNALLENFIDAALTAVVFWLVGFGIAFGADNGSGLFGTTLFMPGLDAADTIYYGNISVLTMFFFQFAFAATASTIATGAMAERTDFVGDLIYSGIIAAVVYPVVVHWVWGGGWLFQQGFFDFAGSTVVHTVGGVTALVGAILLGPRKGKVWGKATAPHNFGLAVIGTMILWFGWYGFNPGSTLGMYGNAGVVGIVALNTTLAAGAGALIAMVFQYFRTKKWDLMAAMNGSLAGLVAITAGCAFVSPVASLIIGVLGGVLVLLVTDLMEKLKIDDPVGAFAVHGACGIFGTLAIGLFAEPSLTPFAANVNSGLGGLLVAGGSAQILVTQLIGSVSTVAWVAVTMGGVFLALKAVKRLRVHAAGEDHIDAYEHGVSAWPDVLPLTEIDAHSGPVGGRSPSAAPAAAD
ncbi:MAG: ammonium transporter [Pleurocapsa minor GSE-CHR-MK-17-07R]|jgi:Amt family ammonium transporter|nr:ammonium transporter [Pleurocapsa minor GSE-CHR-MK 17-07R]